MSEELSAPVWSGLEDFYQRFDQLCGADERAVLQVLSLSDLPISKSVIEQILVKLKWSSAAEEKLADVFQQNFSKWRSKWVKENWISDDQTRIRCSNLLVDMLSRELSMADKVDEVEDAVEQKISRGYWATGIDPAMRYIRTSFYKGNLTYIQEWAGLGDDKWGEVDKDKQEDIFNLCYFPTQIEWLDRLPDWLHYQALVYTLREQMERLELDLGLWKHWIERVDPLTETNQTVCNDSVEFHLYRNELDRSALLLKNMQGSRVTTFKAIELMEKGQYSEALTVFETALKELRKELHKRKINNYGLSALMQQMLYLRNGGAEELGLAVYIGEVVESEFGDQLSVVLENPLALSSVLLKEVALFMLGKVSAGSSYLLNHAHIDSSWGVLFRALARYWSGEEVSQEQRIELNGLISTAQKDEMMLFARHAKSLLACLDTVEQDLEIVDDGGWVHLLHPKQKWEHVLDAISGIADGGTGIVSPNSEKRLVWRMERREHDFPSFYPREQKLGKSGKWSKGRAISLKKLSTDILDYPYLSDQDRRVCGTISESWEYTGGWQQRLTHRLDDEKALVELVGHPLIELEGAPGVLIDITKEDPALEVLEDGMESLKIQLSPFPEQSSGDFESVKLRWEGARRLVVTQYDNTHQHVAQILGVNGVSVPLSAKQRVLDSISAIAPLLTIHSAIGGETDGVEQVEGSTVPHVHLVPENDGIRFSFWVAPFGEEGGRFYPGKGGAVVFGEKDGKKLQAHRDLQQERQRALILFGGMEEAVPDMLLDWSENELLDEHRLDEKLIETPEDSLEVLLYLQSVDNKELVLDWPQDARIPRLRELGVASMKVGVKDSRDWFALSGELEVDNGKVVALKDLWGLLDQTQGRFLKMADGEILALTKELRKKLDAMRSYGGEDGKVHPLALSVLDDALDGMEFNSNKNWSVQRDKIREAENFKPTLPATLEADLRDYQQQGFEWMARLAHWGGGACLADDMGLGKTVQALTLILTRADTGPTLVLAPTSVCMNWIEEANRFAPTLRPIIFGDGSKEERTKTIEEAAAYDLIVCSYGLLQREEKLLNSIEWQNIIIDEAQAIKNAATKRSKAVMSLQGGFKVITTGTPIENHLGELWNLFRFINPGLLGSQDRFNERYARPIENDKNDNARERLKNLISPFILRRLKRDVLTELPPRTEITLHIEMKDEEKVFLEALRQRSIERITQLRSGSDGPQHLQVLAEITRLRQACCHPKLVDADSAISSAKLRVFGETVEELLENNHRALVFSQFVGHLTLIREYLDDRNISYQYLDGSTPVKQRKKAVDAFQQGEGELFLISLKAGGSGLNLTAADYVIHMDPWWNPAVEDQASDRAHRMGQTRPVTIYRMIVKGTIEEKIVELHQHKRDLADQLLEGSDQGGRLSVDEMVALIQQESY